MFKTGLSAFLTNPASNEGQNMIWMIYEISFREQLDIILTRQRLHIFAFVMMYQYA